MGKNKYRQAAEAAKAKAAEEKVVETTAIEETGTVTTDGGVVPTPIAEDAKEVAKPETSVETTTEETGSDTTDGETDLTSIAEDAEEVAKTEEVTVEEEKTIEETNAEKEDTDNEDEPKVQMDGEGAPASINAEEVTVDSEEEIAKPETVVEEEEIVAQSSDEVPTAPTPIAETIAPKVKVITSKFGGNKGLNVTSAPRFAKPIKVQSAGVAEKVKNAKAGDIVTKVEYISLHGVKTFIGFKSVKVIAGELANPSKQLKNVRIANQAAFDWICANVKDRELVKKVSILK